MTAVEGRTAQATEYLVLEQRELKDADGQPVIAWVERSTVTTATRNAAVQEVAGDTEGVWRPVPTRNWQQAIRTRRETITKTRIEPVESF